ncbi:hypothetical protein XBO1_2650044 [Xenorhabdus bovienii str. oregonense]|uniref:Uncharacterized protein n=1 Tax=Xenorhabdus bovienii str. oregonense TaxID=1398202 RepID=A0A077NYS5_XENBV|nr:hypothetical protein XBO1_2650044 [Xenorhabdus bovienii str. oregonense]
MEIKIIIFQIDKKYSYFFQSWHAIGFNSYVGTRSLLNTAKVMESIAERINQIQIKGEQK